MAAKTRRLTDLFVVGRELTIDDGDGGITVYVKKLNPVEMETALRFANSVRAITSSMKEDETSPQLLNMQYEVDDFDKDGLVEYLVEMTLARRRAAIEAEVAAEEHLPEDGRRWSKDDYLQGLQDAWVGGLWEVRANHPDDEEANRVFSALQEFADEVEKKTEKIREEVTATYEPRAVEALKSEVLDAKIQYEADMAWMREYRKCEVWLATRISKDDRTRYFEDREEVDELENPVFLKILEEVEDLSVDATEGKDSRQTEASSSPSEPQDPQETDKPSGQLVAVE